jgi:hypothetical protein
MADITKLKITDPELNFPPASAYGVQVGPTSQTHYQFVASSYSNSNANWRVTVPNPSTVMSRAVLVKQPVTLNFTQTGQYAGNATLIDGQDAFRAFPLEKCIDSTILNINGLSMTVQSKYLIRALERYMPQDALKHASSIGPSMADNFQDYSDAVGGITNSPFGNVQKQGYDHLSGRATNPFTINSNVVDGTTASISADLYFWLKITPLTYGDHTSYGLANVETLDVQLQYSNLERMWSRDVSLNANRVLTGLGVTLGQPSLYCVFSNAGEYTPIPRSVTYPYTNMILRSNTTGQSAVAGASFAVTSNSLQFNTVPQSLYIWVGRSDSEINTSVSTKTEFSDAHCSIESIDITFDNRAGILSTANKVQLYDICRRNGLNDNYTGFGGFSTIFGGSANPIGTSGSLLCLEFGKNIPLKSDTLVSSTGVFNFSIQVNGVNRSKTTINNLELSILEIQTGALTIANGSASSFIGVVGPSDSSSLKELPVPNLEQPLSYGGNMLSKFGELSSRAMKDPAFRKYACASESSESSGSGVIGGAVPGGNRRSLRFR